MMHDWTHPQALRQQVQRLWDRGELLRQCVDEAVPDPEQRDREPVLRFPRRLRLKKPTAAQMSEHFTDVRQWIVAVSDLRHTRLEYREIQHRQLGRNRVPDSLWIDSLDEALAFIGKRGEAQRFLVLVQEALEIEPRLITWIRLRPVSVLERSGEWSRLLRAFEAMRKPRSEALYLRQLSVPGVDTKFIEAHRGVLTEWLELTQLAERVDERYRGSRGFARRFGFRDKPSRLRLRSLDTSCALLRVDNTSPDALRDAMTCADLTLDNAVLSVLEPCHQRTLIVENEINYLSLPHLESTLAIFGSGYGFQMLSDIVWLQHQDIWYWGDLDTHGFSILDQLRSVLPQVRSVLMDRETLLKHESLWGRESGPANRALVNLTVDEAAVYRDLVEQRYGENVRLEQEQIDYEHVLLQLRAI